MASKNRLVTISFLICSG